MLAKTVEDFAVAGKTSTAVSSPKNKHESDLLESEQNLAQVRLKHHDNRRRSKYTQSSLHRLSFGRLL